MMVKFWVGEVLTSGRSGPESWSSMVIVATSVGVSRRGIGELTGGEIAGAVENRVGLVLATTENNTVWADSLAGPLRDAVAQPATVWAPASSNTTSLAPLVKLGASLTGVMSMVKLWVGEVLSLGGTPDPESER